MGMYMPMQYSLFEFDVCERLCYSCCVTGRCGFSVSVCSSLETSLFLLLIKAQRHVWSVAGVASVCPVCLSLETSLFLLLIKAQRHVWSVAGVASVCSVCSSLQTSHFLLLIKAQRHVCISSVVPHAIKHHQGCDSSQIPRHLTRFIA
jgi:hypothetical protein